ncbi:MAG: hypothetical protein ACI8PT_004897 [Gammaproteobacteria bacterium]|jgi:hypothetical protein
MSLHRFGEGYRNGLHHANTSPTKWLSNDPITPFPIGCLVERLVRRRPCIWRRKPLRLRSPCWRTPNGRCPLGKLRVSTSTEAARVTLAYQVVG